MSCLVARRAAPFALAAVTAAACGDPPAAPGPRPAFRYDLVFASLAAPTLNQSTLFVLRDGAGAPTALFPDHAPAGQPSVTAAGDWMAYVAPGPGEVAQTLWIARGDGTARRRVATAGADLVMQPALSPDGQRLAFVRLSDADGGASLWTVRHDGTDERELLTVGPGVRRAVRTPAWSPDGRLVAFATGEPGHLRLWVVQADGSAYARLTAPPPDGTAASDVEPSWAPDGRQIAFVRTSSPTAADLHVVDVTTGSVRALGLSGSNREPAWAPDGGRIAFTRAVDPATRHTELYTVAPDGAGLTRLTHNDVNEWRPAWRRAAAGGP